MDSKGLRRKKTAQALRVTDAANSGGLKVCPEPLQRIIDLANLPGNTHLPDFDFHSFRTYGIPESGFLPDPVRLRLLEVWSSPDLWKMTVQEWIGGWEYAKPSVEDAAGFLRAAAAADHYALIKGSRAALLAVTNGTEVFPVTTFLKRVTVDAPSKKAKKQYKVKAAYAGDPISDALVDEQTELDYIRRCEHCHRFFYAQRDNQYTCPPEDTGKASRCANARRAQQKRDNERTKRELAKKRKRATVARQR